MLLVRPRSFQPLGPTVTKILTRRVVLVHGVEGIVIDYVRLRGNDAHVRRAKAELPSAGTRDLAPAGLTLQLLDGVHLLRHAVSLDRHVAQPALLVDGLVGDGRGRPVG